MLQRMSWLIAAMSVLVVVIAAGSGGAASIPSGDAIEAGYIETNVARGKRRRLKESRPRRTWLELSDVRAILAAAGKHRALTRHDDPRGPAGRRTDGASLA